MEFQTLHVVDTEYSADSVEWCLHKNFLEYFACGTYQLDDSVANSASQAPCRRKGRIYLFQYEITTGVLKELHRLESAAILDMKWLHYHEEEFPLLATANALGQIYIYSLEQKQLQFKHCHELNPTDDNVLALSLEWSPILENAANVYKLIVSDSKGCITLLIYNGIDLKKIRTWSAHNFEAWTCTFDKWDINRIFTGGDDTTLNSFDIRDTDNIVESYKNKSHMAGVTAILSHPRKENILITGSYDDRLRTFDTRHLKNSLTEINLGGGIWRIRADSLTKERNLILCACMYKNFSVVKLIDDCCNISLEGTYDEHESICYGADWCLQKEDVTQNLIMGTCSFYDHKLCVSKVNCNFKDLI